MEDRSQPVHARVFLQGEWSLRSTREWRQADTSVASVSGGLFSEATAPDLTVSGLCHSAAKCAESAVFLSGELSLGTSCEY